MARETQPFRYRVTAGYSASFNGRTVQPKALMAYLEEAAAEHCRAIGRDVFTLLESGQGWVLTGGSLKIFRYPVYGQDLIIETWISNWRSFSGIREYRIIEPGGELVAEAGGRWVYWNMNIRRPMPIPAVFRDGWFRQDDSPYRRMFPKSHTPTFPDAAPGAEGMESLNLDVRRGDVDLYGHLHNTTYMDWLMEAVPDDVYRDSVPREMGLRFFGEARLGDKVSFSTRRAADGWLHEVRRPTDDKLLARGFSSWSTRSRLNCA